MIEDDNPVLYDRGRFAAESYYGSGFQVYSLHTMRYVARDYPNSNKRIKHTSTNYQEQRL